MQRSTLGTDMRLGHGPRGSSNSGAVGGRCAAHLPKKTTVALATPDIYIGPFPTEESAQERGKNLRNDDAVKDHIKRATTNV